MDIMARIKQQIESDSVVLYMKGTPQFPQCGFSGRVIQALGKCEAKFSYIDILNDPEVRANLPAYANWPTFPQLYIDQELVGGCDIVMDLFERGELLEMINKSAPKADPESNPETSPETNPETSNENA